MPGDAEVTKAVCIRCLLFAAIVAGITGCGSGGAGTAPSPPAFPELSSVTPASVLVGSPALSFTAAGTNFTSSSQVEWDGTPLNTSYVSSTSLQAQVPASDLAEPGVHQVVVVNPSPGGGTSYPQTFVVIAASGTKITVLDVQANDIVWDPTYKKIYASQPSTATANGNSITAIDPTTGNVTTSQPAGSEPDLLAISDDSQYLYAALDGSGYIQRFTLPDLTKDISFSLGPDPPYGPYQAIGLQVAPGSPHTTAIVLGNMGDGVIYDDSTPRPATIPSITNGGPGVGQIQWGTDASSLCAESYSDGFGEPILCYTVDSSGFVPRNQYGEGGPLEGVYVHFDPGTGYLYSDHGSVSDPKAGRVLGFYYPPYYLQTNFSLDDLVPDSQLNRVFVLGQTPEQYGVGHGDFTLDAFDQTHFTHVGSMVIPGVVGLPTHFIRWGNAGLAFTTETFPGPFVPLKIYLIDGDFVNGGVAPDSSTGTDYGPFPSILTMVPQSATADAASLTLTVTGQAFTTDSIVQWNGQALTTTFVSSTNLQAQVPSADLSTAAANVVTVSNPSSIAAISNQLTFTVFPPQAAGTTIAAINLAGQDLAWDPNAGRLYAAVLDFDLNYGNSVATVNPSTATIESAAFAGSEPMLVRISGDSNPAYVGFLGSGSVQEFSLPNFTPGVQWSLGYDSFGNPLYPFDLQIAPGSPHTTAVSMADWWTTPAALGGVAIYDDNVARPVIAPGFPYALYDSLQWGMVPTNLYAVNFEGGADFYILSVNASGVSLIDDYQFDLNSNDLYRLHFDAGTGYLYEDNGQVINPTNGAIVGSFTGSGYVVPDSSVNRVFMLGTPNQPNPQELAIEVFDQTTYALLGAIVVPNVVGTPSSFIRWGSSGLAFTTFNGAILSGLGVNFTPGMLYIVNSTMVSSANARLSSTVPNVHVRKTWKTPVGPWPSVRKPAGHASN